LSRRLIEWSLDNRAVVLLLTLLMAGIGLYSLTILPIDAVPDVTNVQVQINTNAPGLAPEEVERFLTFPIEQAMTGLPDVTEVRSLSKYGLSQVTVVFADWVDLYFARSLVFERLQDARGQIPEGLGEPEMGPISSGLGEIYQYQVVGEGLTPQQLRTIQDWEVKRQLRTVPGVTEVNSFGGQEMQFEVLVDPDLLRARGLGLRDVFRALAENNRNAGAGFLEHRDEQYLVRGIGMLRGPEDIGNVVIAEVRGTPVYVRDVARVVEGSALRQGAVTRDGKGEVVTGIVMMLIRENSRIVAQRADARVDEINESLPEGVRLKPFYDRTALVNRTIRTVATNLAEGAFLVILVLFAILGNFRAAVVVALAIPLSMLFASTLMVRFGISGNLMSLGAIDFGLVVDGAVVMVENTVRRLSQASGHDVLSVVRDAALEVGKPIVFGVGIIMVVYLPILTLTGMEGKMFRPMAWTVVFALGGSLLLALTAIPVLASLFLKGPRHAAPGSEAEHEGAIVRWASRLYRPMLRGSLRHPGLLVGIATALFGLSLAAFPYLGAEFLPQLDEGAVAVQAIRLPSVSLTKSLDMATRIEKALLEFPEVETVVSKTGRPDIATDPMGIEISDIIVMLKPHEEWKIQSKNELVDAMRERLERIPGIEFSFSQPIQLRVDELISGVRSGVGLKLFGEDMDVLRATAEKVAARLRQIPGATDVNVEQVTGLPYLQVHIDRQAIARHGLNVQDVQDVLETAIGQKVAGTVFQGDRRFDLVARLEERFRKDPESIGSLTVPTPDGGFLPLSQLAEIRVETGVAQISREQAQRRIVVEMNVTGRDMVGFVEEAKAAVAPLIPAGYFTDWGGQFENFERARNRLLIVVPVSLLLILLLLYANFGSLTQALLIFCNVPFAITGGVAALFLRGLPFSISAGVGFIALFGVAVLNGLVMLSYINQLRAEGRPLEEAVEEGATARLRPVLMTALVASLGFIPMAMSHGAGAEVQRPLATVVIGGLVTSTLLTLLVLPSVYSWIEARRVPHARADQELQARN